MSTTYPPILIDTTASSIQRNFGGEDTLGWNFTSATGNPLEIQVSSSTYFTFTRTGIVQVEAGLTFNADTGGDIGEQYDHRPANVNAATQIAVGAASGTGDGARLSLNTLTLGHSNVTKYIDADQGTGTNPSIRYHSGHAQWEFTNDGLSWGAIATVSGGATTPTWDDIYLGDQTLDIDNTVLTFSQSSVTGIGFTVTRNLAAASTDNVVMSVANANATDDQNTLKVTSAGTGTSLEVVQTNASGGLVDFQNTTATSVFQITNEGRVAITGGSAIAGGDGEAVSIEQQDAGNPIFTMIGDAGVTGSNTIDTNPSNGVSVRVFAGASGGTSGYWMRLWNTADPAFGVSDWDSLYAADKLLDINDAVLDFQGTHISNDVFRLGGTGSGNVLEVWDGTIGSGQQVLTVAGNGGFVNVEMNHATMGLGASQNGAGPIFTAWANFVGSVKRLEVLKTGATDITADATGDVALTARQDSATGTGIFEGKAGSNTRHLLTYGGKTTLTSDAAVGSELLELAQADADQGFIHFNGTASDPAGGVVPADNLTEVNGTGAVVGPQTTGGAGETGWAYYGMVKVTVDAVGGGTQNVWLAGYTPATS